MEPKTSLGSVPVFAAPTTTHQEHCNDENYTPRNYHRLAEIMRKDRNFAIFRRFDDLNMINLMELQAEILELRGLFRDQCREDDRNGHRDLEEGPSAYSSYFHALRDPRNTRKSVPQVDNGADMGGIPEREPTAHVHTQLELISTLRRKMSEYSKLRFFHLMNLENNVNRYFAPSRLAIITTSCEFPHG